MVGRTGRMLPSGPALSSKIRKVIEKIYHDEKHPAGFSSYNNLRRHLPYTIKSSDIKLFLQEQESYTLHKKVLRKFERDFFFVTNIDDCWQMDLFDMQKFSTVNDGVKYILIVIDVLSKFMWCRCLKNKTGKLVTEAFEDIIQTGDRKPLKIQVDKGKEFINHTFEKYLKESDIHMYSTENSDIKCSIAERAILTIKSKIYRYFSHIGNTRYIDVIQDMVVAYNNTYHTSIKTIPSSVTEHNFLDVWNTLYSNKLFLKGNKPKYVIGDHVRISQERKAFRKSYNNTYTKEIFQICSVLNRRPIMYELVDLNKEKLKGRFYEKELQKVLEPTYHKINEILRTRGTGRSKELYVSWEGYDSKFNSWIKAADLKK
jgi:hypothetical protein